MADQWFTMLACNGPNVNGDCPFERFFNPQFSPMHCGIPEGQLIAYCPGKQVSSLQIKNPNTGAFKLDKTTLVIHIDGAMRNAGTHHAQASYGVYFGPKSCYNCRGLLNPKLPQTGLRAGIEALSRALDKMEQIITCDLKLLEVYFVSDNPDLVRSVVELIDGWIENHGFTEEGQKVPYYEALKTIHERLEEMAYGDEGGVDFKFWLVPQEMNGNANALANSVFNR